METGRGCRCVFTTCSKIELPPGCGSFLPALLPVRPRSFFSPPAIWGSLWLAVLGVLSIASVAAAPPTGTPAKENLFGGNAGFEQNQNTQDNLRDGVDSDGYLHVTPFSAKVLTEKGTFDGMAMPPSVAFADLNGDGKPDLIVAGPNGYFYFYPNSGTAAAPRFTNAEIIPLFASATPVDEKNDFRETQKDYRRFCPRISLADWRKTGLLDLLIGNYDGEILFAPNTGTARQPQFRLQGGSIAGAAIATSEGGHLWANLLSPVGVDWTGHGRLDLVVGEGTYSANAIHLLENVGSASEPKFSSAKRTYLAYGDGREQLIPTVVDYNADGSADLVVADRTGEVGVYLNPGKGHAGEELKRVSTLSFGGTTKLPGLVAPLAADFNGDGLFDLIFGLPDGRIGVALNTGTKGSPSFGPLQEIKGVDRLGRNENPPLTWNGETHQELGNVLAYFSVVGLKDDPASQPPEGNNCLKAGFWPAVWQTFPLPATGLPGTVRQFDLKRRDLVLKLNQSYHFSFKVKGAGMEHLRYRFWALFDGFPGLVKEEQNERGGMRRSGERVAETIVDQADFNASSSWQTVEGSFTPHYKSSLLRDEKTASFIFDLTFEAADLSAAVYFDDFQLAAGSGN